MKKPKVKGVMEFITISMGPKRKGPRMMREDTGVERPAAMDLSELLSKMGFPPMMHPMRMKEEMPEEMEDEEMEDEGEDEMEDEMEGEEEDNKDLDTVELIQKLIKKLEEHCANLYMTGDSGRRGK